MLLLINHRYPRLGAILSTLSSLVFLLIGIEDHRTWLIAMSTAGIALSAVQLTVRYRRAATTQAAQAAQAR
jgi:hydrogenase-4 membrane subunit HyfE